MCKFFSLVSKGNGKALYFDSELRKRCKDGDLKDRNYEVDSHTSIADYYGYKGMMEDRLNKYEYNPLTKKFTIDQINTKDDSEQIKVFCNRLNFKKIIPELNSHPIINPLIDIKTLKVTKKDKELLKEWIKVRDSVKGSIVGSVRGSVGGSVKGSIGGSIWDSIWGSIGDSVGDSVWGSVGGSVWGNVGGSIWGSVWSSVWDSIRSSVYAYISSFFDLKQYKGIKHKEGVNPFQSAIDLWNRGLVPGFDGKIWRLHGYKGKVLYEKKR